MSDTDSVPLSEWTLNALVVADPDDVAAYRERVLDDVQDTVNDLVESHGEVSAQSLAVAYVVAIKSAADLHAVDGS